MSTYTKKKLLLIGAGPTSSLICYNIARNQTLKNAFDIHIWEKARGMGGRFSTSRSPKNPDCIADLGAQYLTLSQDHPSSRAYFDNLKQHNLIRPLNTTDIPGFRNDSTKLHFSCVQGSASIIKHFFSQASIQRENINFMKRVKRIEPKSGKVEVSADNGTNDIFDLVVSTMPCPQILQLENFSSLVKDGESKANLDAVKYSTRFALALFFDSEISLKSSNKPINFVENDPIIRYWSIENLKRHGSITGPTSVVVHTNTDFGAKNADVDKENLKKPLLEKVTSTLVPEASNIPDDSVKSHKWRYSQVTDPYSGKPGCIKLAEQVFAAGDSFSGSGLEGCIDSAEQTINLLKSCL